MAGPILWGPNNTSNNLQNKLNLGDLQVLANDGNINYIRNGNAESGLSTGWATYADAAGNLPVNGTGGSPNITYSVNSSSPLAGNFDFNLIKGAANRQGEGASYDFTINSDDQGQVLQINFNWKVVSGTFAGSVTPGTYSDVIVYIYDVTNSVLIEPQGCLLDPAISGYQYKYRGTFQTNTNSTSYRLIFHISTTSATAYTLAFDNISVGPQVISNGAVVTDPVAYTPSTAGIGTPSNVSVFYQRIGKILKVYGSLTTGTVTGSPFKIGLPSGLSIDTSAIETTALVGNFANGADTNVTFVNYVVAFTGTATDGVYMSRRLGSNNDTPLTIQNASAIVSNSSAVSFYFEVPILGWSSNVQMSNDSSTRVVAAYISGSPANSSAGNPTIWPTVVKDTHGAYNTSTGEYTLPVAGTYQVNVNMNATIAAGNLVQIYKNGSLYSVIGIGNLANSLSIGAGVVIGNAGDIITIRNDSSLTSYTGTGKNNFSIFLLSGPSQVAASETIAASYYLSANFTSSSSTPINFNTKIYDTHGAVTPSATVWKFTAPAAGIYCMNLYTQYSGGAGSSSYIDVYKNGSKYMTIGFVSTSVPLASAGTIQLIAGDYIDFRTSSTFDNGGAALNATGPNVSIFRI